MLKWHSSIAQQPQLKNEFKSFLNYKSYFGRPQLFIVWEETLQTSEKGILGKVYKTSCIEVRFYVTFLILKY